MATDSSLCFCFWQPSFDSVIPNLRVRSVLKWLLVSHHMWVKTVKTNIYGIVIYLWFYECFHCCGFGCNKQWVVVSLIECGLIWVGEGYKAHLECHAGTYSLPHTTTGSNVLRVSVHRSVFVWYLTQASLAVDSQKEVLLWWLI